jgi:hypothetical protein
MTNLNSTAPILTGQAEAMLDTAQATAREFDMSTVPDMNEVEMATAIGQLTATLNLLIAALRPRTTTT